MKLYHFTGHLSKMHTYPLPYTHTHPTSKRAGHMKKKPPIPVCLHFVIEEASEDAPLTEGSCYDNGLLQAVKHVAQENEAPQAGTNWKSLQEGAHEGEVSIGRVDHTPTGDRERSKLRGSEGYFSVLVSISLHFVVSPHSAIPIPSHFCLAPFAPSCLYLAAPVSIWLNFVVSVPPNQAISVPLLLT